MKEIAFVLSFCGSHLQYSLSPFLRYLLNCCCDVPGQVSNLGDEDYFSMYSARFLQGHSQPGGLSCWAASLAFGLIGMTVRDRVSFETSFDSKQPKLEPKLVSALSETKRLFRMFRFYTQTESFDVSIEPKQTGDQPKQFDREHIL
jgi:hypothetical protein